MIIFLIIVTMEIVQFTDIGIMIVYIIIIIIIIIRNIKKMMKAGYEVYSGTMIGLPFQTDENLVEDILLMKELGVDGVE